MWAAILDAWEELTHTEILTYAELNAFYYEDLLVQATDDPEG